MSSSTRAVLLWRRLQTQQKWSSTCYQCFIKDNNFSGEEQILLMTFPLLKSHANSWDVFGQVLPAAFGSCLRAGVPVSPSAAVQCWASKAVLFRDCCLPDWAHGSEGYPFSAASEEHSPTEQPVSTICSKMKTRAQFPFPEGCVLYRCQ